MKQSNMFPHLAGLAALTAFAGLAQATLPIGVGNLVVVRVGDGAAALTSSSQAVFLEEFTTSGTAVNTVAMPIVASGPQFPFTNSGTATSEGFVTTAGTGSATKLILGGYGTIPGSIGSVVTTTSAVVPRVVGVVDLNGTIDTTTALSDAYSAGNIRGACSDGTSFWTTGSNNGIRYAAALGATTSVQVSTSAPTNTRTADINAGQLYATSGSGAFIGLNSIGTGLPVGPDVATLLPGFNTITGASPYDFYFADATTVYVADDRTTAGGGIYKWTFAAGTWTNAYVLVAGTGVGCRGLTGTNIGGVVTLYATTTQSSANSLVSVVDTGATSTFTTLATAVTNTVFRGVRIVPGNGSTPFTSFCSGDAVGTTCLGCGNNGAVGRGCANSSFASGALLVSSGVASLSGDTLVLTASDIPGPGLFFQANGVAASPITFGDGMLCAAVGIIRMGVVFPTAGSASYPGGLTPNPVSIAAAPINPGDLKHYQCWYRDAAAFCTTATFNTSNGVSLTWAP